MFFQFWRRSTRREDGSPPRSISTELRRDPAGGTSVRIRFASELPSEADRTAAEAITELVKTLNGLGMEIAIDHTRTLGDAVELFWAHQQVKKPPEVSSPTGRRPPLVFSPHEVGVWPEGLTLSREQIYDDSGRGA